MFQDDGLLSYVGLLTHSTWIILKAERGSAAANINLGEPRSELGCTKIELW